MWLGAAGCFLGGWLTDRYIRRTGDRKWGRKLFGIIGHSLCALCYAGCLFMKTPFTFALLISLGAFCNDLTMGSSWATCQDIGRKYTAIVAGFMNMIGNLGGAAAGWVTGAILDSTLNVHANAENLELSQMTKAQIDAGLMAGYQINFICFAGVYVLAVLFWLRIDATQPVVPEGDA